MSYALKQMLIVDYFHEYALHPFLERFVTCIEKGGDGNTAIEECKNCKRFRGIKESSWKSNVLCMCNNKLKKGKAIWNTREIPLNKRGRHKKLDTTNKVKEN